MFIPCIARTLLAPDPFIRGWMYPYVEVIIRLHKNTRLNVIDDIIFAEDLIKSFSSTLYCFFK